jgi:hypothetical protein
MLGLMMERLSSARTGARMYRRRSLHHHLNTTTTSSSTKTYSQALQFMPAVALHCHHP